MFASATCVRAGAVSQAAFEIIRQAWIISIQVRTGLGRVTGLLLHAAVPMSLALVVGAGSARQGVRSRGGMRVIIIKVYVAWWCGRQHGVSCRTDVFPQPHAYIPAHHLRLLLNQFSDSLLLLCCASCICLCCSSSSL